MRNQRCNSGNICPWSRTPRCESRNPFYSFSLALYIFITFFYLDVSLSLSHTWTQVETHISLCILLVSRSSQSYLGMREAKACAAHCFWSRVPRSQWHLSHRRRRRRRRELLNREPAVSRSHGNPHLSLCSSSPSPLPPLFPTTTTITTENRDLRLHRLHRYGAATPAPSPPSAFNYHTISLELTLSSTLPVSERHPWPSVLELSYCSGELLACSTAGKENREHRESESPRAGGKEGETSRKNLEALKSCQARRLSFSIALFELLFLKCRIKRKTLALVIILKMWHIFSYRFTSNSTQSTIAFCCANFQVPIIPVSVIQRLFWELICFCST